MHNIYGRPVKMKTILGTGGRGGGGEGAGTLSKMSANLV